ncbi:uncharacterized protein LOC111633451 [Centruroides sculpturatus]|uniref:uncharacterized protein LOC111633451 n=1 Tax=Centruroides sculpturatus TaxID=218467 RepID=UPI000C6DF893|nr:uncharacterized protein LOC111633451 [Centruroides sculpturatus]
MQESTLPILNSSINYMKTVNIQDENLVVLGTAEAAYAVSESEEPVLDLSTPSPTASTSYSQSAPTKRFEESRHQNKKQKTSHVAELSQLVQRQHEETREVDNQILTLLKDQNDLFRQSLNLQKEFNNLIAALVNKNK